MNGSDERLYKRAPAIHALSHSRPSDIDSYFIISIFRVCEKLCDVNL